MKKLGSSGQKVLKMFHLITAGCWTAGAFTMTILYFLKSGVTDGKELYGINSSIHFIDNYVVVIMGAMGCLFTGLAYSIFTGWGFFKQRWLIFKWIVTVSAILFGTFYLGKWEKAMLYISGTLGSAALSDPAYLYNQKMQFIFGTVQMAVLFFTVYVSVFKPWKKKQTK